MRHPERKLVEPQRRPTNIDQETVRGFGEEWAAFDQSRLIGREYQKLFDGYFGVFPFSELAANAEGFDLGCGSGRWAAGVAPRVGRLHCIDPSEQALEVARRRLAPHSNVDFHLASADTIPLADASQSFGYSLGVLHHVPDTARALSDCVRKLKPGAPFLVYLYYKLDDRPPWFQALWRMTDLARRMIAGLPFGIRKGVTTVIAAMVYWPLARGAHLAEKAGLDVAGIPLSPYRYRSFYSMRTDALDRFGTKLEQRFSRDEIHAMMIEAGLIDIRFSDQPPYWVACGRKRA
jgi:SAM-dependent methyltransferase